MKKQYKSSSIFSKFFFWFFVYFSSIAIITFLLKDTKLSASVPGFYIIIGFLLVITSRIVYSARHKKNFRLKGLFLWGIIYSLVFGLLTKILSTLPKIQVTVAYDSYLNLALFSILFTIVLMFLRRMKIKGGRVTRKTPFFLRAPSQILSGIALFISGLLIFRFSYQIFVGWFNWVEGMAWSWLFGIIFILAGLLTLKAWWRNNVSNFNTQHNFRWRN